MNASAENSTEHTRTGGSVDSLKRAFTDNLFYVTGRTFRKATPIDHYTALAYTVRDRLLERFIHTAQDYRHQRAKTVAYLSAEFLTGPHLGNNILNLGLWPNLSQALTELGLDLDTVLDTEQEPGLGNGGLGRLAACFMDSLATLEIPAIGYGIRYEYGIFDQEIHDGWQVEITDAWLRNGNPWKSFSTVVFSSSVCNAATPLMAIAPTQARLAIRTALSPRSSIRDIRARRPWSPRKVIRTSSMNLLLIS
jgi:Glucan phosphorylase